MRGKDRKREGRGIAVSRECRESGDGVEAVSEERNKVGRKNWVVLSTPPWRANDGGQTAKRHVPWRNGFQKLRLGWTARATSDRDNDERQRRTTTMATMAEQQQPTNIEIGVDENGNQLSVEEVWDDSALVDSWEEAVEEYNVRFLSSGAC